MARREPVRPEQSYVDSGRLDELSVEALGCRMSGGVGHAWPRDAKMVPIRRSKAGKVLSASREMDCDHGCGTTRIEVFEILPNGTVVRDGNITYRHAIPYSLKPNEPGESIRIDGAQLRYNLFRRMYKDWGL